MYCNGFTTWTGTSLVFPGGHPTDILIEFEILSKFVVPWFKMCSTDHNKIFNTSWQCYCHDVYKISLWSTEYIMNKSIKTFHQILNWGEILLLGQVPGHILLVVWTSIIQNLAHDQVTCPMTLMAINKTGLKECYFGDNPINQNRDDSSTGLQRK